MSDRQLDSRIPHPEPVDSVERALARARARSRLFGKKAAHPKIGRFEVLHEVGAGAMGIVYACRDAALRRNVAVKLLNPTAEQSAGGKERLTREAQAMAAVSHPNVVPVFEVGEHEDRVFVAMELVPGTTLRVWTDQHRRSWRELLDKYLEAASGLSAAHARGLVHRDFKPDNVLVGDDDRVRVVDFGLVCSGDAIAVGASQIDVAATALTLTQTGTVLGTPAYMAPEQFDGSTSPQSDQFAWAVALWEALFRERPFSGETLITLRASIANGPRLSANRHTCPAWLRRVLARAMSEDPQRRFRSLDEIQKICRRKLRPVRAGRLVTWLGVTGALLGALSLATAGSETPTVGCAPPDEALGWSRESVHQLTNELSSRAGAEPWITASFEAGYSTIAAWRDRWDALYENACAAQTHPTAQTRRRALLQLECLEEYGAIAANDRTELDALDHEALVQLAADYRGGPSLPALSDCENETVLLRRPRLPQDRELRTAVLEAPRSAAAAILIQHGRRREGLELLEDVQASLARPQLDAFTADLLLAKARLLADFDLAAPERQAELVAEALRKAERVGYDAAVCDALVFQATLASRAGEPTDALRGRAQVAADRAGRPFRSRHRLAVFDVNDAINRGNAAAWVAAQQILVELVSEPGHEPELIGRLRQQAKALQAAGRGEDARKPLDRALRLTARRVGDQHPTMAVLHVELGEVLLSAGLAAEGRRAFDRATEVLEAAFDEPPVDAVSVGFRRAQAELEFGLTLGRPGTSDDERQLPIE